ncbi:MAG: histidine--tRNA ligase [Candidatus Saccharibacteria bacterium]|nr:histidine--tRNA ligase [Candidatus Saccharibacteria bacterium]
MNSLSTQSYKGARDYYPQEKRLQNYIFSVWRRTVESFGYEEYGAPLLEPLEIYTAKSGQELAGEQTYLFADRGGRQVAIRPEMTPTISRMVAARRQELAMPARLYSIANFMRYERPQRGREREFWQLNADLFGVDGPAADAEIIELGYRAVMNFGAREDMFTVRVNSRQLINQLMSQFLGLDIIGATMMTKLLDKKNKIPPEVFRQEAIDIFGTEGAKEGLPKLARMLGMRQVDDLPAELANTSSVQQIRMVMELLRQKGIGNAVFDVTLMRGLDYYTGTVFELFDNSPENNRALFGGGRYDGLVGLFGVEPVATVGVGMGATTMQQFLEVHKLLPTLATQTDVYIIPVGDTLAGADALARQLRSEGVRAELDITGRKIDKQLKTALKKQIPFAVFVGEEELKDGVYTVKNLVESTEQRVDPDRIVSIVTDRRYDGDDAAFSI